MLKDKLSKIFSGSYDIIRKNVGIRPATFDRRPYIGHLAKNEHINIFNGFGTKGVSLVPFFTKLFVQKLRKGDNLPEAVRLDR
jgi:glycine/D-amino acid oxidase-like deaminating enzyme